MIQRDFVKTSRRNAEALIRTSTLTIMRRAHMDIYEANSDVIGSVQWLATLDGRTTPLCRALDGLEWTLPGYEPKGHNQPFPGPSAHWNCRSVVIPITKTWEQLAKEAGGDSRLAKELDNIEPSERASLGGPVDASVTYQEWFAGQPKEAQLEILGKAKYDLYEQGNLPLVEMTRPDGNPATVDELETQLFHVDEKRFTDWFEWMEAEYREVIKKYKREIDIRNNMPKETITVIDLPPLVKAKLETKAKSFFFSGDGVAKQLLHHSDLEIAEYVKAINKIKDCTKDDIHRDGDYHVVLIIHEGVCYKMTLKGTEDYSEVYLLSLHKLNEVTKEETLKKLKKKNRK